MEGVSEFSGVRFVRTLILLMRVLSSWPNPCQQAPPPNTVTLGVRFQHMNRGGEGGTVPNTQSTVPSKVWDARSGAAEEAACVDYHYVMRILNCPGLTCGPRRLHRKLARWPQKANKANLVYRILPEKMFTRLPRASESTGISVMFIGSVRTCTQAPFFTALFH